VQRSLLAGRRPRQHSPDQLRELRGRKENRKGKGTTGETCPEFLRPNSDCGGGEVCWTQSRGPTCLGERRGPAGPAREPAGGFSQQAPRDTGSEATEVPEKWDASVKPKPVMQDGSARRPLRKVPYGIQVVQEDGHEQCIWQGKLIQKRRHSMARKLTLRLHGMLHPQCASYELKIANAALATLTSMRTLTNAFFSHQFRGDATEYLFALRLQHSL